MRRCSGIVVLIKRGSCGIWNNGRAFVRGFDHRILYIMQTLDIGKT